MTFMSRLLQLRLARTFKYLLVGVAVILLGAIGAQLVVLSYELRGKRVQSMLVCTEYEVHSYMSMAGGEPTVHKVHVCKRYDEILKISGLRDM